VKQPPLKYLLLFSLMLNPTAALAEELEGWGDWGMDSGRLELIPELERTDQLPLSAREQAIFRTLDNSTLQDYGKTESSEFESDDQTLLEQLERLEQLHDAELLIEENGDVILIGTDGQTTTLPPDEADELLDLMEEYEQSEMEMSESDEEMDEDIPYDEELDDHYYDDESDLDPLLEQQSEMELDEDALSELLDEALNESDALTEDQREQLFDVLSDGDIESFDTLLESMDIELEMDDLDEIDFDDAEITGVED